MVPLREFSVLIPMEMLVKLPSVAATWVDTYKDFCQSKYPDMKLMSYTCPIREHVHVNGMAPTPLITLYMAIAQGHDLKMLARYLALALGYGLGLECVNIVKAV